MENNIESIAANREWLKLLSKNVETVIGEEIAAVLDAAADMEGAAEIAGLFFCTSGEWKRYLV